MPTAAFVAGPEALFRAQPGPLLKNRVFRLEPLFFPGRPLGGPWEALGGCPGHPGTGCPGAPPGQVVPGPPRDRLSWGVPGRPGLSWDKCPGAPPGHPQDSCPGGPPGRPGTPPGHCPGALPGRRPSISVLKNHILNRDPGRSWGPPHLGCFWRQTFPLKGGSEFEARGGLRRLFCL